MLSPTEKLGQRHWIHGTKSAYAIECLACAFCLIHVSKWILQSLPWEEGGMAVAEETSQEKAEVGADA